MKILVTGANGFLGRGIITELIKQGNEVIATDFETVLSVRGRFELIAIYLKLRIPMCFMVNQIKFCI